MWKYIEMFLIVLAFLIGGPLFLSVAAGVLYLYGAGIWWVALYVIGLF